MSKIFDAILSLVFLGISGLGVVGLHDLVRKEALLRVHRGLSSTYKFTQALTGEKFDWER